MYQCTTCYYFTGYYTNSNDLTRLPLCYNHTFMIVSHLLQTHHPCRYKISSKSTFFTLIFFDLPPHLWQTYLVCEWWHHQVYATARDPDSEEALDAGEGLDVSPVDQDPTCNEIKPSHNTIQNNTISLAKVLLDPIFMLK